MHTDCHSLKAGFKESVLNMDKIRVLTVQEEEFPNEEFSGQMGRTAEAEHKQNKLITITS